MEAVLEERDQNKEDSKIGRRIYLYFSGHGFMPTSDKEEDVAVLMADAQDPNFLGNHVLANAWADVFYKSGYFQEVLLFVDACRNVLTTAPRNLPFMTPATDPQAKKKGRRFYAYAAKWDRTARERTLPEGARGVFTKALLEGLRGGASNPATNNIGASDLRSFLYQNTVQFLAEDERSENDSDNSPQIDPEADPALDFLIVENVPNVPYPVRIVPRPEHLGRRFTVYKGRKAVTKTETLKPPYFSCTLPCAAYLGILETAGGQEQEFTIEVKHPGFDFCNGKDTGVYIVPL